MQLYPRLLLTSFIIISTTGCVYAKSQYKIEESTPVATVPSGFPVGFMLLTSGTTQYVAFYDEDHNMTVASRELGSADWTYQTLPSRVGWDSHNYITMALDETGHLHVSGNMHNVPLVYFKTAQPGDVQTLQPFPMTGEEGDKITYPRFLKDHEDRLIFGFRRGASGRGARFFNVFDSGNQSWSRLLDTPLFDGEDERNAYPLGPLKGPDGYFHLVWVWRDTPDCATNHHLSHARSPDLVNWESAFGQDVSLPLVLGEERTWIDPIPSGGGIINGCQKLFFDEANRPVVVYHKRDSAGNMQIFAARAEAGAWKLHTLTDWTEPVPFRGYGTMGFIGIKITDLDRVKPGVFYIDYRHKDYGQGRIFVDEETLRPLEGSYEVLPEIPPEIEELESDFAGMKIQRRWDTGESPEERVRYLIQWETLPSNRDRPREPPLPQPGLLKVHKLVEAD